MDKIELLNPYNDRQLESFNDFCLYNDLPNLAKSLQEKTKSQTEQNYFRSLQLSYVTDSYLLEIKDEKVTDYCYIHSEKDTKKAIITYPELLNRHHHKQFLKESITYVLNDLSMDELFLTLPITDHYTNKIFTSLGYFPIDQDDSLTTYFFAKDEKLKNNIK
ncbi:MAG TPA: hypothetical protein IAB45_00135 [Candidatus Onthousia faecavium]|nr:hypothetical protein [Candidatus Onthousia faecavium]